MLGKNTVLAVGAVIAGLVLPSQAMAQYDAVTRTDLNLRVGPGTDFGVIDVIPGGDPVDVLGCLEDYEWCDIEWDGLRGWVSATYLEHRGMSAYLPQVAPRIGVPIVSFSFGIYHDRHYRDRPWHRERRGRWRGRDWRDDGRGDDRAEERRDGRERQAEPRQRRERSERSERRSESRAGQRSRRQGRNGGGEEEIRRR